LDENSTNQKYVQKRKTLCIMFLLSGALKGPGKSVPLSEYSSWQSISAEKGWSS